MTNERLPRYHSGPAKAALADLLRARGEVNAVGNVVLEGAYRAVEELDRGYTAKHTRRMIDSGRNLKPKALEQLAQVLEVEPEYFREYRIHQLEEWMETWPEVVDTVYDMAKGKVAQLEAKKARRGK
jgi:hypothetical protein